MNADIIDCDRNKEISSKLQDLRSLPDFAALCSFLTSFGSDLGIHLTFPQLCDFLALRDSAKTKIWETLHVKLLNKLKYRARPDRWEPVLGRFLLNHGLHIDGIQTAAQFLLDNENVNDEKLNVFVRESPGHVSSYYKLSSDVRTKTLLCLLETQFDRNQPFKDRANLRSPVDLRSPPLGVDVWGRSYWLLKDSDINIYLYREDREDNSFQLLCESFDGMRDLIEELKGAFSEDEKLEIVFKKKRVSSDKSILKDHLTNLIQDDIASPELQISKNDESSTIFPESPSNEDLKLTATPLPTPTCFQKPAIHSVDMLLAFSKPEDLNKTESQENVELDEIVSGNDGKVNGNANEIQAFEMEQKCSDANEEYQIKPECTTELVLKPDDNYDEYMNRNTESLAVGQYTPILSSNELKKSRKHSSTRSCSENVPNEQDLRRSSRQRKPVQVFNIQPTQSKRSKLPTPVTDSTVNNENEKHRRQKIPIVKRHVAPNGHAIDKSQKRKKKRHRKKPRKGSNPWAYGTSSSDSDAEDDSFEKALMQHLNVDSDDSNSRLRKKADKHINTEWSDAPESDFDPSGLDIQSDADSVTDGRNLARQKRLQKKFESNPSTHCNVDEKEEPCQICFKSHLPDWILLCDRCDLGHHAMCLSPPLHVIPEGDWFCPRCQHTALISALNETITVLETESKKRNIWKRMQERLNFVNISMTNILGDDDSDCIERKNKKGKTLRNTQKDNVKYAYDDSCSDDENEAMASASHSDEESANSNTDSGVDGKSHGNSNKDNRFRHKSLVQISKPRRVKFREISEESESESDSEPLPHRNTRQRQVKYKISEAFKELDEALEADEKYQEEKQRKRKRKANGNFNQVDSEVDIDDNSELNRRTPKKSHGKDLSNILGPDWEEFEVDTLKSRQKRRRISDLSPSSSSEHSDEDIISGKTRRSSRTKDEDFKPSSSEVSESEDDIESRKYISSDDFEQASSDNSWLATSRRSSRSLRGNTRKKRQSNYSRRSRKPVPYFEDSDEDSDRAALRTRRCTRAVVSYRESNDDSENSFSDAPITSRCSVRRVLDDDEEADVKMDKTKADRSPTPLSLSVKAKRTQSKRTLLKSSSDSDYQPCDNDDNDSQDDGEQESKKVYIKPVPTTITESQSDESNHQHSTSELMISETSDIDNSLFKDSTKSISFETVDCKIESADNIVTNLFTKSVDHLNGNNYDNDEEVEDEADECLPVRNLQSHVSPNFDKQITEIKPCISPDIF
ncbi:hypothetical protein MN116_003871 [Schistosoma mekongi]|uniref:PHD-type domain-containing protein n=1 Tax=Schistosoma mekongi TaxID=38744 RepID=A0AAE1ZF19_SCHME|nr:hypothetical protein MN116_003871 [Schistosoma mekongi]